MVAQSRLLDAGGRHLCRADGGLAAVVDVAGRHLQRVLARLGGADRRLSRLLPLAEAAGLRAAAGVVRARSSRHAVVGGVLGRAVPCPRPRHQVPVPAGTVPLLRALDPRHVGVRRLPRFLYRADGGVLAGAARPRGHVEAGQRHARHLRQELHQPEPGVHALRRRAGLPDLQAVTRRKDMAGVAALCGRGEPACQHDLRHRLAYRPRDDAGDAGGIRSCSTCDGEPAC